MQRTTRFGLAAILTGLTIFASISSAAVGRWAQIEKPKQTCIAPPLPDPGDHTFGGPMPRQVPCED
jgi:hypothetical protein